MPDKTRPKAEERVALMGLYTMAASMKKHSEPLFGRMAHDAYAMRGLKTARTLIRNAIAAVKETIDPESFAYIEKNSRDHEIVIRPRSIVKDPAWMYSRTCDLEVVLTAVIEEKCGLCMLDGKAINSCKLRKAMLNIIDEPEADYGCGYRRGIDRTEKER
jgi:hypothetical protein